MKAITLYTESECDDERWKKNKKVLNVRRHEKELKKWNCSF